MSTSSMESQGRCTLCGGPVRRGDAVWCAHCAALHHRPCWSEEGGCAAMGCTELHALDAPPVGVAEGLDRVDLDTPLERSLFALAIGLSLASLLIVFMGAATEDVLTCFLLAGLFTWLYRNTDCSYFLDRRRRRVLYLRDVAGWAHRHTVASFDEVALVAVSACRLHALGGARRIGEGWAYWVLLVLVDGRCIPVTDPVPFDVNAVNARARVLARSLDVPLHEGRDECPVEPRLEGGHPVMRPSERITALHCLIPRIVTALTAALVILVVLVVAWGRRPENMLRRHGWSYELQPRALVLRGDGEPMAWDFRQDLTLAVELDESRVRPAMWKLQGVMLSLRGRSPSLGGGLPHALFLVPADGRVEARLRDMVARPPARGTRLRIVGHEARPRPLGTASPLRFTSWTDASGDRVSSSFVVVRRIDPETAATTSH